VEDYAKYACKAFKEERQAMERLGMLAKN